MLGRGQGPKALSTYRSSGADTKRMDESGKWEELGVGCCFEGRGHWVRSAFHSAVPVSPAGTASLGQSLSRALVPRPTNCALAGSGYLRSDGATRRVVQKPCCRFLNEWR
ncbi:hypothetical protein MRX96_042705 [Rhipicephalus microplus]